MLQGLSGKRIAAGALSGVAGGMAFAAVMFADMAVSRRNVNDFLLLGGLGPAPSAWRVTGPTMHVINSAALGTAYAVVEPRLRGPGWARGVTFALVENTVLWPVVLVLDRVHPAVKSGALPSFNSAWPFVAENLRHIAYGFVLGLLFERKTGRHR